MKYLFKENNFIMEIPFMRQVNGITYKNQRPYKIIISLDEIDNILYRQEDAIIAWRNIKEYINRDIIPSVCKGGEVVLIA